MGGCWDSGEPHAAGPVEFHCEVGTQCYGFSTKCPPKTHALRAWSPKLPCSEVGFLECDWGLEGCKFIRGWVHNWVALPEGDKNGNGAKERDPEVADLGTVFGPCPSSLAYSLFCATLFHSSTLPCCRPESSGAANNRPKPPKP